MKPRSKADMLKRLGLSNQTVNFRRHIQPLLEQGLIARTIPEEPNHPSQKYITTIAGREMI
ncbi:Fic family protein [Thermophagus sp. OGC60D27]|uniref:Fic family protein n=1 Tax=Thermophagus sp. OGC60D27 TaxID=3458415 RepID=UPI0040377A58